MRTLSLCTLFQRHFNPPITLNDTDHHRKKVGNQVWMTLRYFSDAYAATQPSRKLSTRRYGPFRIYKLFVKNAFRLAFPLNMRSDNVIHFKYKEPRVLCSANTSQWYHLHDCYHNQTTLDIWSSSLTKF